MNWPSQWIEGYSIVVPGSFGSHVIIAALSSAEGSVLLFLSKVPGAA